MNKNECVFVSVVLILLLIGSLYLINVKLCFSLASSSYEKSLQALGSTFTSNVTSSPSRIQEGSTTSIAIRIKGEINTTYTLRINVTNPAGNFSYVDLDIETNATGFGDSSLRYWSNFTGADTDLVGVYHIYLQNATTNEKLASASFTVGLTDKLRYTRNETVKIQASGYNNTEKVIVNIETRGVSVTGYPKNVTADTEGVVTDSWTIPKNAMLGTYKVSITNTTLEGTVKIPADIQNFEVGVVCQIQTVNLANQTVSDIWVEVYNSDTLNVTLLSDRTNASGWIRFDLDIGNYTFKAFWREVEVGVISNVSVTENKILTLSCQLTNIKILVIDKAGAPIPFISLTADYNYTTRKNVTIQKTESFLTNNTGKWEMYDMFTNISYLFKAQRYGHTFNQTYITRMEASPWFNITITLPEYTMLIHVVDSKNNSAEGVKVEAYEWSSGLGKPDQSETTDSNGNATLFLAFGKYRFRAYKDDVLLNETAIDLILDQSSFIFHLAIYNVDFNVTVIDYFGQPFPNAVVKVEQKTTAESVESTTGPDGRATFSGILGGDSRISIYIKGKLSGSRDLYLTYSKQVAFNLSRYVVIAGYAAETSQFVVAIVIAILIVVFIVAQTYKRLLKILIKRK